MLSEEKKNIRPYRYDIVGSFLRPKELKEARNSFENGKISKEDLKKIEDSAIKDLVEKEIKYGIKAVTDGEFRRKMWHMDFLENLKGIKKIDQENWSVEFTKEKPKGATLVITDKIDFPEDHPFIEHLKYLKSISGEHDIKFTIPSPSMLHLIPCVRSSETYIPIPIYKSNPNLIFDDITSTYVKAMKTFYSLGLRYLQFDDTSWGEFCDEKKRENYLKKGINVDEIGKKYVEVINNIMKNKPKDMTISMHICRGNFMSSWFSTGGYQKVEDILFSNCNIDAFFLEFDSERAGNFEPLKKIKNQIVVLGLITSKDGKLEKKEDVIARIREAEKFVKLEQLCISTQCGFSSTEEGNKITENEQWEKIKLVKEIANEVWKC